MSDCGKPYSEKKALAKVLSTPRGARLQQLKKDFESKAKNYSEKAREMDTKIQAMKNALIKAEFTRVAPKIGETYQVISRSGSAIHVATVTEHVLSRWNVPTIKARSYLKNGMVKGCFEFTLEHWEFIPLPPKKVKG